MSAERTESPVPNLSLQQIFGNGYNLPRRAVKLEGQLFHDLQGGNNEQANEEMKKMMKQYGIGSIHLLTETADGYYAYENPASEIAWWVPHSQEMGLLHDLALAVAPEGQTPTILDAACGTGMLSRLLAASTKGRVIGVDTDPIAGKLLDSFSQPAGEEILPSTNVWDVAEKFGPEYDEDVLKEKRALFATIKEQDDVDLYTTHYGGQRTVNVGYTEYPEEIQRLQEIAPRYIKPSPID